MAADRMVDLDQRTDRDPIEEMRLAASWARSGADYMDTVYRQVVAEVERLRDHYRDILTAADEALSFWGIESDDGYQDAMHQLRRAVEIAKEREEEADDA